MAAVDVFFGPDLDPLFPLGPWGTLSFCDFGFANTAQAPVPPPLPDVLSLSPPVGPTTGGTEITILGTGLSLAPCEGVLTVIDPLFWTLINTGSGHITALPTAEYELDTGLTVNSRAGLRTTDSATAIDVRATFRTRLSDLRIAPSTGLGTLALIVSTTPGSETDFRLELERVPAGRRLRMRVRQNGQITADQFLSLGVITDGGVVLRILRTASRVLIFVNGAVVIDATWVATSAVTEISVANHASIVSRAVVRMRDHRRNPVVIFEAEPMRDFSFLSNTRIIGPSPPHKIPGVVDVTVTTCSGTDILLDVFTYVLPDLLYLRDATRRMTQIVDSTVRRP